MSCTSPSCTSPGKPRISFVGIDAVGKKLNPKSTQDWRLLAAHLDPAKFTDEWIQLTEFNCQQAHFSPTGKVLREWQQGLRGDQEVPVKQLIHVVVKKLGRLDVESLINKMCEDGTFLDPVSTHDTGPSSSSCHTYTCLQSGNASPRESPDRDGQDQSSSENGLLTPSVPMAPQHVTSARAGPVTHPESCLGETGRLHHSLPTSMPGPQSGQTPQNFNRSQLSLGCQSEPNDKRERAHDRATLTWPQRGAGRAQTRPAVRVNRHEQSAGAYERVHSYIPPLTSFSGENSSPLPGPAPYQKSCYFIVSALKSFKRACDLGIELKRLGHEVLVDKKMDGASEKEKQEAIYALYRKATYIIVIYNSDFVAELSGRVHSSLNSRFIFNLMDSEFKQRGNARFIPVIDHKRICNIPLMLHDTPGHSKDYIFKVLRDFNTANPRRGKEVCIERVVYTHH